MGWFDEQIRQRKAGEQAVFSDAFDKMAGAVLGRRIFDVLDESRVTKNAIDEILKYYHIPTQEIPASVKKLDEQLEYLLRPYGIMRRNVELKDKWYQDAFGAMLGVRKSDGNVTALLPSGLAGYTFLDFETGKRVRITKKNADQFETEALAFYKPFPLRKLGLSELLRYIAEVLSAADYLLLALVTLVVTGIGMLTPYLNHVFFADVIPSGQIALLQAAGIFLVCTILSSLLFSSVRNLLTARIQTKLDVTVQAAAMIRVLSLPADFFKDYSAGELSARIQYMNSICTILTEAILQIGLTSVFSLLYLIQIWQYTPTLALPAVLILLVTLLLSLAAAFVQIKISQRQMALSAKENGMSFALISGVQKIKLSGSEKRAFARWGNLYAQQAELLYRPPLFLTLHPVLTTAVSLAGTMILYALAVHTQTDTASYYAFYTAFGMVSGAFVNISDIALQTANIRPMLEMVKPILETVPEVSERKHVLTRISGGIELNNVSFRYAENMPLVLDDLSLKIRAGQYIAIVGKSGCGKSTLMRLLLGFERPQKGAVYFDGKDLNSIDLKSLRRKIGVVMQNGKLFQGDIFSNIAISAPDLTLDDAWEVAEKAGIAEDIRNMPMGMFTMVSEGGGGISGGQRQRIIIARAIAGKPKILMFDEATSALDNLTQKTVSDTLDHLKCTRIVIAHRLSTIRQCDRIIVLDKGKIIEDGSYDELLEKKGFFADLVSRQQIQ